MKLKNAILSVTILSLAACSSTLTKLEELQSGPQLAKIENPAQEPLKNWPTPVEIKQNKLPNSLWKTGARSFFKDQRAARVGDILTVIVKISDKADLDNATQTSRTGEEDISATAFFGFENLVKSKILTDDTDLSSLANIDTSKAMSGSGKIGRKEDIETKLSAIITQVLPNGNFVIKGTQQVKVNHEMREVALEGVIRPEDIASDNSIQSEQIAEARISYGGRGTITYANQERYGYGLIDAISPF